MINDLESKGWKVNEVSGYFFCTRISTGKKACFIESGINEEELLRVWNKGYHPFTFKIDKIGKIEYFDCLFDEVVKFP